MSIIYAKMQTPTHQAFFLLLVGWDKTPRQGGEGEYELSPIGDRKTKLMISTLIKVVALLVCSRLMIGDSMKILLKSGVESELLRAVGGREAREVFAAGGPSSPAGR